VIRELNADDVDAADALVAASWSNDPVLAGISQIHGERLDTGDRRRRSLVYEVDGTVVGVGTLASTSRHPSRLFVVIAVAPDRRRQGIGTALLHELRTLGDGRPLIARTRESDRGAVAFLHAHGFGHLMRNRTGVVDPGDPRVAHWVDNQEPVAFDHEASREEIACAHEVAYGWEHASWSPTSTRPPAESLRLFCGESWIAESALLARGERSAVGVAGLHGPPLAPSASELFLIAGTSAGDARTLRALVAAELVLARTWDAHVSIEADEANEHLWEILAELPAVLEPDLLLLSTDAAPVTSRSRVS
jgi:GNAT superfamily N-acetyltransferase